MRLPHKQRPYVRGRGNRMHVFPKRDIVAAPARRPLAAQSPEPRQCGGRVDHEPPCSHPRRPRRALADRRLLRHQPRRQDRGRGRRRGAHRRRGGRAAASACPMRATARPSRACGGDRGDARGAIAAASTERLQQAMPAGAARNALDCALWDLEAKREGSPRMRSRAGRAAPLTTAYTISLGTPDAMAAAPRRPAERAAAQGQARRRRRSRTHRGGAAAAPARELIVDRQRGLDAGRSRPRTSPPARKPASRWSSSRCRPATMRWRASRGRCRSAPTRACTTAPARGARRQVRRGQHQARQDRRADRGAGHGPTEAERLGFDVMVGCMVATSLAMAWPCWWRRARVVDLDGALLLARDRLDGLVYDGSRIHPSTSALWGDRCPTAGARAEISLTQAAAELSRTRSRKPSWEGAPRTAGNSFLGTASLNGRRPGGEPRL